MRYILALFLSFTLAFSQASDDFDAEFNQKSNNFDPLSGYNRVMTNVNDKIYTYVFDPIVDGYRYVVPEQGRWAIGNFFDNLLYPLRLVNNLLQFKFAEAGDETLRFIANTIVGFGGISDVATTYYKIPRHDEDFGQTLGSWSVGSGFHIVLPILGPSNLRDTIGLVGDFFTKPINYVEPDEASLGLNILSTGNEMAQNPNMYKNLKKDAVDLYPFLRDAYEQRRNHLIKE